MKLYYVMDPMCSWCWGFRPVFAQVVEKLPDELEIQHVMGGLAADSDAPMPEKIRAYVQSQWRAVEARTGAKFNWDFWEQCQPRRSTYPACRAVIAAGQQAEKQIAEMIFAIQQAYYLQARNPSDIDTLVSLARDIGLDDKRFAQDLLSEDTEQQLQAHFKLRRQLCVTSFPSLRLQHDNQVFTIDIDYQHSGRIMQQIQELISPAVI